jgi:hypothetical protein
MIYSLSCLLNKTREEADAGMPFERPVGERVDLILLADVAHDRFDARRARRSA